MALSRGTGLRSTGLKRRRSRPKLPKDLERLQAQLRAQWMAQTRGQRCAICGAVAPGEAGPDDKLVEWIRGHHVIRQQVIVAACGYRFDEAALRLQWDVRNHLAICDGCHDAHHHPPAGRRRLRIPRKVIDRRCRLLGEFMDAVGIDARRAYDRDYPA